MVTDAEMSELIQAVQKVSRDTILPRFRNLDAADIASKSAADDLVTIADREAEVALSEAATRILPGAAIVGEEAVSADPSHLDKIAGAARCVIIDPIDGTANFVAGLATFGVILAVVENGRTVFGLLYDPVVDDWVAARAGHGAWFGRDGAENRPLSCRKVAAAEATGFVGPRLYPVASRGALFDAYQGFGLVRGSGLFLSRLSDDCVWEGGFCVLADDEPLGPCRGCAGGAGSRWRCARGRARRLCAVHDQRAHCGERHARAVARHRGRGGGGAPVTAGVRQQRPGRKSFQRIWTEFF